VVLGQQPLQFVSVARYDLSLHQNPKTTGRLAALVLKCVSCRLLALPVLDFSRQPGV
jgi:hypothetical protein